MTQYSLSPATPTLDYLTRSSTTRKNSDSTDFVITAPACVSSIAIIITVRATSHSFAPLDSRDITFICTKPLSKHGKAAQSPTSVQNRSVAKQTGRVASA